MFRKILVANDGSAGARRALAIALDLAARYGAQVHAISVEEGLPHYAATIDEVDAVKEQENHYFEQVAAEARSMAAARGVSLQTHILPGHEVETIIRFCLEGGFDLLVVGFMATPASSSASGAAPPRASPGSPPAACWWPKTPLAIPWTW